MHGGKQIYVTEYSVSVGETQVDHDTSNAAAFIMRLIGELDGIVEVLSYWAFSVRTLHVACSRNLFISSSIIMIVYAVCVVFDFHVLIVLSVEYPGRCI